LIFNEYDHARLATLFGGTKGGIGTGPYAGYKPDTREAPNGDTKLCPECEGARVGQPRAVACKTCGNSGRVPNVDTGKRYLHVALKYNPPAWALAYLARAHFEACRVAEALGVPAEFYPRVADGTLRVLEYPSAAHNIRGVHTVSGCVACGTSVLATRFDPRGVCPALAPGSGSAEHTDFDLFTVNLWRSTPEDHEQIVIHDGGCYGPEPVWEPGAREFHIGELGELVGLGPATPHRVPARPYVQKSIVYFAMPDHDTWLPLEACPTVGEWLKERMARSRVTAGGYK
jgi:hypothetical protein